MTKDYDIASPPTAEEWLALDEGERIAAVAAAHERTRSPVGKSPNVHASIHVAVENRLAEGHTAVVAAFDRLRAAGFDRHAAIHALASVVTRHMLAVVEQGARFDQAAADADFEKLDPETLRKKR